MHADSYLMSCVGILMDTIVTTCVILQVT